MWYEENYWPDRYSFTLGGKDLHSYKKTMRIRNEYRSLSKEFAEAKPQYLNCQEEYGACQQVVSHNMSNLPSHLSDAWAFFFRREHVSCVL